MRVAIIGASVAGALADIERAIDRTVYIANEVIDHGKSLDEMFPRLPPPQAPTYSPPPNRTGNRERERRARQEARRAERTTRTPPSGLAAGGAA